MSNSVLVVFVFEMSQYCLFPPKLMYQLLAKIQINGCCKQQKKGCHSESLI